MSGLVVKQTDFSSYFKNMSVLAIDDRSPRYLLTPIGHGNLEEVLMLKIKNEHEIERILSLNMKNVQFINSKLGRGSQYDSLLDHMLAMKNKYDCQFEYKINSMNDIADALVLPSGFIFEMFVIKFNMQTVAPNEDEMNEKIAVKVYQNDFLE